MVQSGLVVWKESVGLVGRVSLRAPLLPARVAARSGAPDLGGCDFDVREFPEVRVHHAFRALADKEFAVALDDKGDEAARGGGVCVCRGWGVDSCKFCFRATQSLLHGAGGALRRARRADERAEFHEGLVEWEQAPLQATACSGRRLRAESRPAACTTSASASCQSWALVCFRARIGGDAVDAGQDADDVAVENGRGLIEGDAANRAGGVAANAGQREDGVESSREIGRRAARGFVARPFAGCGRGCSSRGLPRVCGVWRARLWRQLESSAARASSVPNRG